jgi:thymidylate synthase
MNQLDEDYKGLLGSCLYNGIEKTDRTGTGTLSVFGRQIKHRMKDGFPLLTTKKMAIKTMMTELKWFLKGRTDIQYLRDNGCKIWDGDYDKSGRTDGELGPIYGKQWRDWGHGVLENKHLGQIDQIKNLINDLKTNPDSRRLMVSAWNVGELNQMVLPPCHYGFQVYTRDLGLDERIELYNSDKLPMNQSLDYLHEQLDSMGIPRKGISLMWNQRSVDTFLGLPFNIASYATLLIILGKEVNMMPDYLIGSLGDVHLYKNHIEQAKELITRTPYKLPKLEITNCDIQNGEFDWELINYQSHPSIKAPLSN